MLGATSAPQIVKTALKKKQQKNKKQLQMLKSWQQVSKVKTIQGEKSQSPSEYLGEEQGWDQQT